MASLKPKIGLNIGCGGKYKPGFINIDPFNTSTVDIVAHAAFLPFKSKTIFNIEAIHIIEHFDWVEVKYLLNEWFRILKNDGELIVETPDIKKSVDKLVSLKDFKSQTALLQWIYGIDEVGMRHKSGFIPSVIKIFLEKTGFVNIQSKKPIHHRYEPGFRIVSNKSAGNIRTVDLLIHAFRTQISALIILGNLKDVSLLEKNHILPIEFFLSKYANERKIISQSIILSKEFAKLIICNPLLAKELFISLKKSFNIKKEDFANMELLLEYFIEFKVHQKFFSQWYLRKKTPGKFQNEFLDFIANLELKIQDAIVKPTKFRKLFNYVTSLEEEPIPFFDIFFILEKASLFYNQGIKAFSCKNHKEAKNLFCESLKLNPDNYLGYWNLARLGVIIRDNEFKEHYGLAFELAPDKHVKTAINDEIEKILDGSGFDAIAKPVQKS